MMEESGKYHESLPFDLQRKTFHYVLWVRGNKEGTNIRTRSVDVALEWAKEYLKNSEEVVIRKERP